MRAEGRERGKIESGFQRAEDGWHVIVFLEGIDLLKKKTDKGEELATNKQGDKLWKLPMKVNDEDDDSHDVEIDAIAAENKKGEQTVTDFLGATGLFVKFAKAYPGDVSIFDDKVINKVKTQLPGQFMRLKTKQNAYKDKQGQEQIAVNIIGFGKMSDTIDQLEKDFFPDKGGKDDKKGGKKESKETKAPVVEDDPFD